MGNTSGASERQSRINAMRLELRQLTRQTVAESQATDSPISPDAVVEYGERYCVKRHAKSATAPTVANGHLAGMAVSLIGLAVAKSVRGAVLIAGMPRDGRWVNIKDAAPVIGVSTATARKSIREDATVADDWYEFATGREIGSPAGEANFHFYRPTEIGVKRALAFLSANGIPAPRWDVDAPSAEPESTDSAEPESTDSAEPVTLDPALCQALSRSGAQCRKKPLPGSRYCAVKSHAAQRARLRAKPVRRSAD